MPHSRSRYAESLIKRALKHSPLVGLFGQRQVGKTTLLEKLSSSYCTLDRESVATELEVNPELFLQNRPLGFAIDEAQLCPRLFPALKEQVRKNRSMGQFLLSGSVRFTSRRAIRESLTGRISTIEILPFNQSEALEEELPDLLAGLTQVKTQKQLDQTLETWGRLQRKPEQFERYLQTGGLPGISFFRSTEVRADRWETQIDTLLNRDLRLVQTTTLPYQALRDLLEFLAQNQGKPFELNQAVRKTQISAITIKRLLFAYEALFLIRLVRCQGDRKKSTYFLEDQGFSSWISRTGFNHPEDITRGLFANLRHELHYRPERNGRLYQYRTKHDVEVPLIFDDLHVQLGILPSLDTSPRPKVLGSALAFLRKYPKFKAIIAYGGTEALVRDERLFLIPFWQLI